jgi:hypothetical protein
MSSILSKGVIRDGRVEVPERIDLPDGTEVVVINGVSIPGDHGSTSQDETERAPEAMERLRSFQFMTEDEQGEDPTVVQEWIEDLRSIPPVPENAEKEAERRAWDERMHRFNVEAVRKQFEAGSP